MFDSYREYSKAVKKDPNAGNGYLAILILIDIAVFLIELPIKITEVTINHPKWALIGYYTLGIVVFGFVRKDLVGLLIYGTIITGIAYCAARWLADWRRGLIVIRIVRENMRNFYDGVSVNKSIKLVKTPVSGSYRIDFITPDHVDDAALMKKIPMIASTLKSVRYTPMDLDEREGYITVLFSDSDPLEEHLDGADAPVLNMTEDEREDPYQWLGVGVNAFGELAEIPTYTPEGANRNLTQGDSGAGKNSIARQRVLKNTLCPFVDVYICDGKGGSEFAPFKDYVTHYATDKKSFFEQLRLLEEEVARRSETLAENIKSQHNRWSESWNIYDDGNLVYWTWDELGRILGMMSLKEQMEVNQRLFGIASVGRSLGIGMDFISQTFRNDILETKVRDNCFNMATGFKSSDIRESVYIGFGADDEVRPDLIKGKLLKSGRTSTVGQFALRGVGGSWYGKAYYITNQQCIQALKVLDAERDFREEFDTLPV